MSAGRFASLTAGLLGRNGEARASAGSAQVVYALSRSQERFGTPPRENRHAERASPPPSREKLTPPKLRVAAPPRDPPPPAQSDKSRRLMVTVTPGEYETLGLIGVKKNVSRHQLLRNALDEYMALLVEEYSAACQCIYTGCSCGKLS
jgi:hypothetical protein